MKSKQHFTPIIVRFILLTIINFGCNSAQLSEEGVASTTDTLTIVENKEGKTSEDKSKRPSPPARLEARFGDVNIIIDYSQPAVNGRNIFGDIVPYGEIWRTGANEATTITFDKDVVVEGKNLLAGTYALFTIPDEKEWTIIFNRKANQWGAFEYKEADDALRVSVKPVQEKEVTERVTFSMNETGQIIMQWDRTKVSFQLSKG
jgi:hypothetical protein